MLRKGIAIICRTAEEREALCAVANREEYRFENRRELKSVQMIRNLPIRITFNIKGGKDCVSQCDDLDFHLRPGITEVYEASDFLHNIIISRRLKGE